MLVERELKMMEYRGKKLLVLAGADVHRKVVQTAKDMGIYTIVADYLDVKDSPAKQIADEYLDINIYDVDGIVAYCRQNNVDGVLNFCIDPAQRPYQEICERLGLPCYGTKEQFETLTDKRKFKDLCTKYGVDVIPEYSEEDVAKDNIEFPVVVKPVDSRGSRGVVRCDDKNSLLSAIDFAKKASSNGKVIIEKSMEGKHDFAVTYIFAHGEGYLIRTGDRYLGDIKDRLSKQCICSISPSRNSDMYVKNVHSKVVAMFKALGIENGPVFMQGFIDGNTVRFYDPGIRFPGTDYEILFASVSEINPMQLMISYALSGNMPENTQKLGNSYKLKGHCAIQLFISSCAGKIAVYDGIDEISKIPEVITVAQRASIGDIIPASGDIRQRIAEVVLLVNDDREDIKDAILKVQALLKVKDVNGNNMLVSQFDVNKL